MRCRLLLLACLALLAASSLHAATFDEQFLDKTMRVDYFHTSTPRGDEILALDAIVSDGPWSGSRTQLIDRSNLGKYYFEVVDRDTNQSLYSRGFASVFGEWETTPDAKFRPGTFHESLRFPWPKKPVQVILKKRDEANAFQQIWSTVIDPNSRAVNPADRAPAGRVWSYLDNGPASQKVDLLVIGEGYTAAEMPKLHKDVERLVGKLFATDPFKSHRSDFNVRVLELPSAKSGIHQPRTRDDRRTTTGVEYNIFDSERYVLTLDNKAMRDAASSAPYDFLEILVNEQQYGGGGIFNDQATAAVDTGFAEYVFVHEFGHHFAGLADEYYTSPVSYATGATEHPEPWEPNITANGAHPKWMDLVTPGTPLPTPWDKAAFDKHSVEYQAERVRLRESGVPEAQMDALFRRELDWDTKFLGSQQYANRVGAFEGAGYESTGLYRPQSDCIMFSRDEVGFCRVCTRAIERVIDLYSH
ncbi:MAG: peptidase M64 [Acidobacteria bacterium]|nr:peptidase M64 [Acidobacteriota bacterium]MBV9477095.1 peptidase M64 [Acidobacteriota bacterium]